MKDIYLKLILSIGALTLIILRLVWPDVKIDAVTLGLAVFAALPWLSTILESVAFPGGWSV